MVVVWAQREDYARLISVRKPGPNSEGFMKKEYDFSSGKRASVLSTAGKTRITIYLDNATLQRFKAESERTGKGYQTLINEALAQHAGTVESPSSPSGSEGLVKVRV